MIDRTICQECGRFGILRGVVVLGKGFEFLCKYCIDPALDPNLSGEEL